jgi:hypothetical protein
VVRDVAALAGGGEPGIFLWTPPTACCTAAATLFAGPVWLVQGQDSALFPRQPQRVAGYVGAYLATFPDRPLFLVYEGSGAPPPLPGLTTTVARRFAGSMPHWVESSISRPAGAERVGYDFTVYRVTRS